MRLLGRQMRRGRELGVMKVPIYLTAAAALFLMWSFPISHLWWFLLGSTLLMVWTGGVVKMKEIEIANANAIVETHRFEQQSTSGNKREMLLNMWEVAAWGTALLTLILAGIGLFLFIQSGDPLPFNL